jgi:hypothetical protein
VWRARQSFEPLCGAGKQFNGHEMSFGNGQPLSLYLNMCLHKEFAAIVVSSMPASTHGNSSVLGAAKFRRWTSRSL